MEDPISKTLRTIVIPGNLTVSDVLETVGCVDAVVSGSPDRRVRAIADINCETSRDALGFCSTRDDEEARARVRGSRLQTVFCRPRVAAQAIQGKTLIGVHNPRLAFIMASRLVARGDRARSRISDRACVAPSASLASGVEIGPNATVGEDCVIGDATRIHASVVLHAHTRIGARCEIQSGAVLGADGFGFERDANGMLHRFPHYGGIVVGDDVEIGACACIHRGGFGDTIIGAGTKIDAGAYVAHNVEVGRDCMIMAQTVLCGSSRIGDRVEISPGAIVRDKIYIGDGARVGLGAVVVKDVGPGETVIGMPARPQQEASGVSSERCDGWT